MTTAPPFKFGSVAFSAYLPALLFCIGEGAVIPLVPIIAQQQGASIGVAALIASMLMVGQLIGDLPAGVLVRRIGERWAMIGAAAVAIVGLLISCFTSEPIVLALGMVIVGSATSVFALARHAYLTVAVPLRYRARALSTLGGIFRAGYFIGPFISAWLLTMVDENRVVFLVHVICCLLAISVLLATRLPAAPNDVTRGSIARSVVIDFDEPGEPIGLVATVVRYRGVLARVGIAASLIGGLRASRTVILPTAALLVGIPDSRVAIIIGIANGVDFALFFASGWIMDKFGRLWAAVPSMVGLGIGHIALGFVADESSFFVVALFLALANGLGSGILNTLGSDVAPQRNPATFLGAWRLTGDAGQAAAPLLVSGITALAGLAAASTTMGLLGFVGAALLVKYVRRYVPPPVRH